MLMWRNASHKVRNSTLFRPKDQEMGQATHARWASWAGLFPPTGISEVAQIWRRMLKTIDLSHKSYNAPVPYLTTHHFVTEMCMCAHFCYKVMHCGICICTFVYILMNEYELFSILNHCCFHIPDKIINQKFKDRLPVWVVGGGSGEEIGSEDDENDDDDDKRGCFS